jgi:hypothetical protein
MTNAEGRWANGTTAQPGAILLSGAFHRTPKGFSNPPVSVIFFY